MPGTILGFGRASYEQRVKFLLSWSMHSRMGIKKMKNKKSDSDRSSEFGPK